MSELSGFFIQLALGATITLKVALCSVVLGLIFGILGAIAESSQYRLVRYTANTLISAVRGLPELIVLFVVYFGGILLLTDLWGHYVNFSSFVAGVIALALLFGSYASQTFRGAFAAVPIGQIEAARALGLSERQLFFRIHLPQAWRHALPGLGNLWLVLLKDTALVSLIGLGDLMNKAQLAANTTHQPFTFYFAVAVFYLFVTSISEWILHKANKKASLHLAHGIG